MLKINFSLLIQVINFLLLLFVMNILLYKPIRKIIRQRREEMDSLQEKIGDFQNLSDENERGIEQGSILARKEGNATKEGLKTQGHEKEMNILQEASSSAEGKISNAKKGLEEKIRETRKELEDQVAAFSGELAEKILGRSIP